MKKKSTRSLVYIIGLVFITSSCSKDRNDIEGTSTGKTKLVISTSVSGYGGGDMILLGSNTGLKGSSAAVADTTIDLGNGFFLQAELTPAIDSKVGNMIASSGVGDAASPRLFDNAFYRLVVYNKKDGTFVAERLFQSGNEDDATIPPINLDGGVEYTFIAISLNSAAGPEELASEHRNSTLGNGLFQIVGDKDLLFFKKDMVISGNKTDKLDIRFKHLFNQITTTIDAPAIPGFIEALTVGLRTTNNSGSVHFSDERILKEGATKLTSVPFSTIPANSSSVTSAPIIFNAVSGSNSVEITNLTIDGVRKGSNAAPLTVNLNAPLVAGMKYNLKITIAPPDAYLDDYGGLGYDAVRINSLVWMRHNLDVPDYTVNPDIPSDAILGKYYQWGRKETKLLTLPVITPETDLRPVGWEASENRNPYAWNSNPSADVNVREASPMRGGFDPCPTGYRVPTSLEFKKLIPAIIATNNPINTDQIGRQAKVLTSRKNSAIKMTIPKQGVYQQEYLGALDYPIRLVSPNDNLGVWSSYYTEVSPGADNHTAYFSASNISDMSVVINDYPQQKSTVYAMPIRCIAVNSSLKK